MENDSNLDVEYGGFFIRYIAFIIDSTIVALLSIPLQLAILGSTIYIDGAPGGEGLIRQGGILLLVGLVYTLPLWYLKGATLGKMVFGLRIVDTNLQKLALWRLVGRCFAYIISTLSSGLGFIWVIFDERRRGWHDLIAGTVVVKSNSIPEPSNTDS